MVRFRALNTAQIERLINYRTIDTIAREDRRCRANIWFISSINVIDFGGISHLIFFLPGFAETFVEVAKAFFKIDEVPGEEFPADPK